MNYSRIIEIIFEFQKRVVFGPVQLTHGVSEMKKKDRLRNLSTGIIAMLEVVWCGVTTKVPEFIQCTLCGDIMRLCMRKCHYRGVSREHPAYRYVSDFFWFSRPSYRDFHIMSFQKSIIMPRPEKNDKNWVPLRKHEVTVVIGEELCGKYFLK